MFFILDGDAQFTINGRTSQIKGPASAPCRMSNAHAIYNPTDQPMQWMNIAVSTRKGIYDAFNLGDDRVGRAARQDSGLHQRALRQVAAETGRGQRPRNVLYRRALQPEVFYTDWSYVDHLVMPGGKTEEERHAGVEEFYYVLRGSGVVSVDGETAPVKQDDGLPVFRDVHSFENTGSGDMELLVIGVAAEKWKLDTSIIE